jgi:hypothetical protein
VLIVAAMTLSGAGTADAGPVVEEGPPRLALREQTAWVGPGAVFTLAAGPENTVIDPAGTISVRLRDAVANRSEFTIGLGEAGPGPIDTELTVPTSLALQPDGSIALNLPTDESGPLPIDQPGVYPLDVTVDLVDGGTIGLLTHLVRLPAEDERPDLRLALVVPIGAPPLADPDGTVEADPAVVDRVAQQIRPLVEVPDVPLTVVPLPESVESLAATPPGRAAVDGLVAAVDGRQVLGSPYVDLDEGDWVESGLADALGQQFAAGEIAIDATTGITPDGTTRALAEPPTESTLPVLRDEGTARLIAPAETVNPDERPADGPWLGPVLLTSPATQLPTALTDADLQAHAGRSGDPVLDAHRTLADLATVALDRPLAPAGIVMTVPAAGGSADTYLATLLDGLEGGPLQPVTVADWFAEVAPTPAADAGGAPGETLARRVAPREAGGLTQYRDALTLTGLTLGGFTSLTDGTDPSLEDLRRQLLVSGSQQLTESERSQYLAAVRNTIRERTQLIETPADQTVTLTSRSGPIPVTLLNGMGNPARVRLELSSDRLEFPNGSSIDVQLDDEVTTVPVPVRARTTGSFQMEVAVTSPDGVLAVTASKVTIRSTAVSGVGVILSIGAGLVLVTWWLRHWRDRRRDARLVPPPE